MPLVFGLWGIHILSEDFNQLAALPPFQNRSLVVLLSIGLLYCLFLSHIDLKFVLVSKLYIIRRMSCAMLSCWSLPISRICQMPWMQQRSQTSSGCTPCVSATGMLYPPLKMHLPCPFSRSMFHYIPQLYTSNWIFGSALNAHSGPPAYTWFWCLARDRSRQASRGSVLWLTISPIRSIHPTHLAWF